MKKLIVWILAFTTFLNVLCFISCGKQDYAESHKKEIKDDEAYRLLDETNGNMSRLGSYTATTESDFWFSYQGYSFDLEEEIIETFERIGDDDLAHRTETYVDMTVNGVTASTSCMEGFYGGYMYRNYTDGSLTRKLRSPLSASAYELHVESFNESVLDRILWDEELSAQAEITQKGGGAKTVTLTNFNTAFMNQLRAELNLRSISDMITVKSVSVVFNINAYGEYSSIELNFALDMNGKTVKYLAKTEYTDKNTTTVKKNSLDSYHEVSDLRAVVKAERAIANILSEDKVDARLTVAEKLDFGTLQKQALTTYDIKVACADGLEYDINVSSEDKNMILAYHDGVRKSYDDTSGKMTEVSSQASESAVEALVVSDLLNYGLFSANYVDSVELIGIDKVKFSVIVNESLSASRPSPTNELRMKTVEITLTFSGNEISEYETYIAYDGVRSGKTVTGYTVKTVCIFK